MRERVRSCVGIARWSWPTFEQRKLTIVTRMLTQLSVSTNGNEGLLETIKESQVCNGFQRIMGCTKTNRQ